MWITALKLHVTTSNAEDAGTDDTISATFCRRGAALFSMELAQAGYDDLERHTTHDYDALAIPRKVDLTPDNGLPPGMASTNSEHPTSGLEFSYGLPNQLSILLETDGDDMWMMDAVTLFTKESRKVRNGFDSWDWVEDDAWTQQATWDQVTPMSKDADEGHRRITLKCT